MKITIRCFNPGYQKPPFTLNVEPDDTIALLKYQIFDEESIPIHEQRIVPNITGEAPPKDERSLEACNIQDGNIITMYRIPKPLPDFGINEPFKIAIRPTSGRVFLIEVCRSDTLGALKRKIELARGYAVDLQVFNYDGVEDEDDRTLDELHIREPKTLDLWVRKKPEVIEKVTEDDLWR